jgi:flagellar motor switch protein FliN/FliY
MNSNQDAPVNVFIEAFCKAAKDVFSRSLATDWQFQTVEEPAPVADEKLFSLESAQSGGNAKMAVELTREDASKIIEKILGEPVPEGEEINEDQAQIVQSVLEESCTAALSDARWELGQDFAGSLTKPEWEAAASFAVGGTDGESGTIALRVRLNAEAQAAIAAGAEKKIAEPAEEPAATSATTAAPAPAPQPSASISQAVREVAGEENLDLVMDVELDLTLCFGRRQMPLRDILHLGPGSVVELDREVQEPVDLLLGDKVVARGEVVIVDGNYGLRITEVCHPGSAVLAG